MNTNPCHDCGHLRKDHAYFKGDWTCEACYREWEADLRKDYCCMYTPTRFAWGIMRKIKLGADQTRR